jgi:hypothetical protein
LALFVGYGIRLSPALNMGQTGVHTSRSQVSALTCGRGETCQAAAWEERPGAKSHRASSRSGPASKPGLARRGPKTSVTSTFSIPRPPCRYFLALPSQDSYSSDPPIQVETAIWSKAGRLDWWVKERREWWGRVRGADGRQRWIRAVDLRPVSRSALPS